MSSSRLDDSVPQAGGLRRCALVVEYHHVSERRSLLDRLRSSRSLGSVWIFAEPRMSDLDSERTLDELPGWNRVLGPIEFETAVRFSERLAAFLKDSGVEVLQEGVAD